MRDIFALLHGTIRKHGQQIQTVRLRNAWVNVDPRNWKTRDGACRKSAQNLPKNSARSAPKTRSVVGCETGKRFVLDFIFSLLWQVHPRFYRMLPRGCVSVNVGSVPMCSDSSSQLSSTEAARVDTPWMPTRPKIIFGILFAASWLGTLLLEFSFPRLSDWMPLVFFLSGFILLFLTVVDLAFRRWKQLAAALVIWAVALYPIYGYGAPIKWLYGVAFRIHASPLDEYLSGCRLIEFTENGVRQKLGECEAHGQSFRVLVVFYDSTGEFALPLSQRSAEWKKAMGCFSPAKYFTEEDWPATRIWENYYVIHILLNDLDGAGDNC